MGTQELIAQELLLKKKWVLGPSLYFHAGMKE